MIKKMKYLLIGLFLIGCFVSFNLYSFCFGVSVYQQTDFYLPTGSTYESLLNTLKKEELINNEKVFSVLAEKMNLKNNIYPGYYLIEEGTSNYELIAILRGGMQTPVKLVINNIVFKQDLAAKIASQIERDSLSIYTFLFDEERIAEMGYDMDNISCLFLPNTYEVYWNLSLESLLAKFTHAHQSFWNESRLQQAANKGLSSNEVFILASIVEKEYKYASERRRIAGVYVNRLKLGMKLQADPTVKFALGDLSIKRILTVHTALNHPYNTYYYADLPPGPICLPETSTITDVLEAEEHNFLYFCAKADLLGYHTFTKSYNDHLKAARLYQAALNKLRIYE
ncbi:endolytic transglycosylase MltG [Chitinophagales bacterium]|nr:endolytic transglycosylase MltG [Chitinophagales bacterium]